MSFDVFFQGFLAGESSERGGAQIREVLAPRIGEEYEHFFRVRVGDGEADIYLHDGGMMANHIEGRDPWDLLVQGAKAANWVIIPVGCPTCLTQPGQMEELPEGHGREARPPPIMRLMVNRAHQRIRRE
jgi:hypothetical protein